MNNNEEREAIRLAESLTTRSGGNALCGAFISLLLSAHIVCPAGSLQRERQRSGRHGRLRASCLDVFMLLPLQILDYYYCFFF